MNNASKMLIRKNRGKKKKEENRWVIWSVIPRSRNEGHTF